MPKFLCKCRILVRVSQTAKGFFLKPTFCTNFEQSHEEINRYKEWKDQMFLLKVSSIDQNAMQPQRLHVF